MEIERVRWLLRSYLRTRTYKVRDPNLNLRQYRSTQKKRTCLYRKASRAVGPLCPSLLRWYTSFLGEWHPGLIMIVAIRSKQFTDNLHSTSPSPSKYIRLCTPRFLLHGIWLNFSLRSPPPSAPLPKIRSLQKIEKQAQYLLKTPLAKRKMSDIESGYAERYQALTFKHFDQAVIGNIPERLGRLDEEEMSELAILLLFSYFLRAMPPTSLIPSLVYLALLSTYLPRPIAFFSVGAPRGARSCIQVPFHPSKSAWRGGYSVKKTRRSLVLQRRAGKEAELNRFFFWCVVVKPDLDQAVFARARRDCPTIILPE